MNYDELKDELKIKKFLTSDSFDFPDRTYIFLENDEIKQMSFGDIVTSFNIEIYKNILFREVKRIYEIQKDNL